MYWARYSYYLGEMGSILWINAKLVTLQHLLLLLRSAIQCVRGACSSRGNPMKELHLVDLVISESETS